MIPTTQVQFRRGTAAENTTLVGGTGEITIDLSNNRIVVHDAILAGGYTGAKLTDLNTAIANLSGYVNNNAGAAGISVLSGNLFQTGAILYSYIVGTSGTSNHNDGLNISGNLTQTGISLINRDNSISGILDTKIQASGTILYNDIIGLSGTINNNNPNIVYTTGNQSITGSKEFYSPDGVKSLSISGRGLHSSGLKVIDWNAKRLIDSTGIISIDWNSRLLKYLNGAFGFTRFDWQSGLLYCDNGIIQSTAVDLQNSYLYDINGNLSVDWTNRILSGIWNVQTLTVSGNSVITSSQTGGFGSVNTGSLTGAFYPLNSNPSGYLSSYNQSGAYIFSTPVISGFHRQFILFPTNLGNNPFVLCSLTNLSGSENILVQPSGITSSGYHAQYSNVIDSSGYLLTTFASLSTHTGLATTVIIQNVNGVTGNFYPSDSNPSGFITTGQTGSFGANTGQLTGTFYPLATNPSGYITTGQTGQFYPYSNPLSYATSGNLSTTGTTLYNDIITLSGYIAPSQNYNFNVDWSKANIFYTILTGNTNFTFSNQKDGQTIVVSISNTGLAFYSGIWPSVKWQGQTIPTQTSGSFTDIYTFIDITGAIYGNSVKGF